MSGAGPLILLAAAVLGVGVPVLTMRMLVPTLLGEGARTMPNYRGRPVVYGLGAVWFVWAGTSIVAGVFASGVLGSPSLLVVLALAGPGALVAFGAGVIDDAYGGGSSKGFRGHLKALAKGRLTTGGLKVIAIGSTSLVIALWMAAVAPWGTGLDWSARSAIGALLAGAAIALTANLLNLTDLRPGRALKVYALLATLGVLSAGLLFAPAAEAFASQTVLARAFDVAALWVFVMGPLVAVWGFDVGEIAMLGDAGANPMGLIAGLLITLGLPLWALATYTLVVLALNLVSERVSFSRVIEGNAFLRRLDRLGRSDV
jgi:hypothetical protein